MLGFNGFFSFFQIAEGKIHLFHNPEESKRYNSALDNLLDKSDSIHLVSSKLEILNKTDKTLLSLRISADKQYDFDQHVFVAEGNVKATINGGVLRSDLLKYDRTNGLLIAEGNIRFRKGGQYFRGKEFRYNLFEKKGLIRETYGILNVKQVIDDLRIDYKSEKLLDKNNNVDIVGNRKGINFSDGIEFSLANINLPANKITRSKELIGSINNWRFKSDLISIQENSWKSNKIVFTNDPFDPHQISFEGVDVSAEEEDEELIITSSKTYLILDRRSRIFLGKRRFSGHKKKKRKYDLIYDGKDRDGLVLIRRNKITRLNSNIKLDMQPQFLINRAFLDKTSSYKNQETKNIYFSDLFGLNIKLDADYRDWSFDTANDLSTLNVSRISSGIRHYADFKKYYKSSYFDDTSLNIFTAYRFRAWNGTIGETEIKSAYGGFLENSKYFNTGQVKNNLNLRLGLAQYYAEKLLNKNQINLWRSNIFASLDSEWTIWKENQKKEDKIKQLDLTPILIYPEVVLRSNVGLAYFKYEDEGDQSFLSFAVGPEIRLGRLNRNFLDYTKLSIMPGIKIKFGNSPFKFDNVVDLKTLNINFLQQIYGPLLIDIVSNLNIDNNSVNYGESFDTRLGLLWQKRAYEFGIYYHPNNEEGGVFFRINGFDFDNSVKAIF